MYIDYKTTIWQRININVEDADIDEIIAIVKDHQTPNDIFDVLGDRYNFDYIQNEILYDTDEFMSIEDNEGCSTVEVYDDENRIVFENANYKEEVILKST